MISVAMAVYNGEKYLETQMDSILQQTMPADEIIIVDDCSTDGSVEIIQRYQKQHPQIRLFQNGSNLGYKRNFRKAIELCQGSLVFLCDQDDFWHKDKISVMVDIMESNPDIHVLASSFEFMNANGEVYSVKPRKGMSNNNMYLKPVRKHDLVPVTFDEFCSHNYFQGCSMVLTKRAALSYLANWTDCLPHDWLIALLSSHDEGFYFLNIPLFYYRTHSQNTIGVPKGKKAEEWVRLKFAQDMLDVMETIREIWPDEFRKNPVYQQRREFAQKHIQALRDRSFWKLIGQNANPIYPELKSPRARIMDLAFVLMNHRRKSEQ